MITITVTVLVLVYKSFCNTVCIYGHANKATMSDTVLETLLGNGAFHYLSICSISFSSSINSLIPPAPQFNVVQALWSVQSKKQKNQHCFGGKGGRGENVPKPLKNRILLPSALTLLSLIVVVVCLFVEQHSTISVQFSVVLKTELRTCYHQLHSEKLHC